MRFIKDINENEMVIAFLQAEIDSARYGELLNQLLSQNGYDRSIIDHPIIDDPTENAVRAELLASARGYKVNTALFQRFPANIQWKLIGLNKDEVANLRYINDSIYEGEWGALTGNTRLVKDAVWNIRNGAPVNETVSRILKIAADFDGGKTYAELICVAKTVADPHVLIEGHSRATAYVISDALPEELPIIIGISDLIEQWVFF